MHAGGRPDPATGARAVPIYQTTSFVFEDSADAADLFALQTFGNIYSRIVKPHGRRLRGADGASLEGGLGGRGRRERASRRAPHVRLRSPPRATTSSPPAQLYGGTRTLLDVTLRRIGIDTTFVASDDPEAFAAALRPDDEGDLHAR